MRTLIWTGFLTVDGVMDSPGGPIEGHPAGGWVMRTEFVPEAFSLKAEELADTSALMFGRRSYEAFAPIWSQSADHAAYQELPKYVVSATLTETELFGGWGKTHILRSARDVAALKNTEGGSLYIHGSGTLARSLAKAGLIDRYNLLIFPVTIGEGKRMFDDRPLEQRLTLREYDTYRNGVVKAIYDVQR